MNKKWKILQEMCYAMGKDNQWNQSYWGKEKKVLTNQIESKLNKCSKRIFFLSKEWSRINKNILEKDSFLLISSIESASIWLVKIKKVDRI